MSADKSSLTILVPAYNEEGALEDVVRDAQVFMDEKTELDYEVLIYNDGSSDRTGEIADRLAGESERIIVVHNEENKGQGFSVKDAIGKASKDWFTVIPGDNQFVFEDIENHIALLGKTDIIIGYIMNRQRRSLVRRIMSRCFKLAERTLFGLQLPYTGGMNFFKVDQLQALNLKTNSHTILSEIIIRLLRQGKNYQTAGFHLRDRVTGVSQAAKPGAILEAFISTVKLWMEITFRGKGN